MAANGSFNDHTLVPTIQSQASVKSLEPNVTCPCITLIAEFIRTIVDNKCFSGTKPSRGKVGIKVSVAISLTLVRRS